MAKRDRHSQSIRSQIQASIEQAEEERRKELFRRRIELARTGVRNFQQKKYAEAVTALTTYLRILEDYKGVSEGGLTPAHFDKEKDLPELLLINGVYWDLVKLYDRTKSQERLKEFRLYMQKYVQFSKGMPFQTLSAETLRKYIAVEKPLHRDEFKNAYRQIADGKCFVATSLMDECSLETLPRLRRVRDEWLLMSFGGAVLVGAYYRLVGPLGAWILDRSPTRVRRQAARTLDQLASFTEARFRSGPDGR